MKVRHFLKELGVIGLACFILAFAYRSFILPNQIVGGGSSGIATLFVEIFGFNPAITLYAINIPLLVLCYIVLGRDNFRKTVLGSFIYPFMVDITTFLKPLTDDLLLASLFGGVVMGFGLALIYRVDASTGGTSILVQVLKEKMGIPLGLATIIIDGLIVLASLFIFDVEAVLYAIINILVISKTIDLVEVGPPDDLNIFVISNHPEEVIKEVRERLVRTVTILKGKGGYHMQEQDILFFVINNSQYQEFSKIIAAIDPTAFVVVNTAKEVKGRGFSLDRNFMENINRM